MTVSGVINPNYYYFVVINTSNDSTGASGPVPVVAPPWGNGFVAGSATHFIEYNGSLPYDGYSVYTFTSGSSLNQYTATAIPTQDTAASSLSNSLEFTIPLSDIATSSISASSMTSIQVNMIATNRLPTSPTDTSSKEFDSFGDTEYSTAGLNGWATISTAQSGSYSNSRTKLVSGNVQKTNGSGGYSSTTEPDLALTDWSILVER